LFPNWNGKTKVVVVGLLRLRKVIKEKETEGGEGIKKAREIRENLERRKEEEIEYALKDKIR
jgi:hypothetical protein